MPNRPPTHRPGYPKPRREGARPYGRTRWQRLRRRFLASHPQCSQCPRVATEVDHKNGDPDDNRIANLQAFCKSCHSKKTAAHDGSFGRPVARLGDEEA